MLQISLAKPAWPIWFPFPYFCIEGIYGSAFFMVIDNILRYYRQIFGAKYQIVSVPYFTILGLRLESSYTFLKLYLLFSFFIISSGERPFTNLQISMANFGYYCDEWKIFYLFLVILQTLSSDHNILS